MNALSQITNLWIPAGLIGVVLLYFLVWARQREPRRSAGQKWYADQLNTERWRMTRAYALRKARYICKYCQGRATQVNHWGYLPGAPPYHPEYLRRGLLEAVCPDCHDKLPRDRIVPW
jgi:hypothetical protein